MVLRLALAVALAVSTFSLDVSAQRRGRANNGYGGYNGITVYEDPNFRGYFRATDRLFLNAAVIGPSAP